MAKELFFDTDGKEDRLKRRRRRILRECSKSDIGP